MLQEIMVNCPYVRVAMKVFDLTRAQWEVAQSLLL